MTNQRVVPAADYDAAIEVGAEEIAESQRLRAALRKLLDALDAQFDGMDRSGELLHEAQQAAERLLSGEPGSAVETCERRYVWQCSNPSCGQIWEADPHGHCPACLQSNGVGWSCICVFPRHLPAQKASECCHFRAFGQLPCEKPKGHDGDHTCQLPSDHPGGTEPLSQIVADLEMAIFPDLSRSIADRLEIVEKVLRQLRAAQKSSDNCPVRLKEAGQLLIRCWNSPLPQALRYDIGQFLDKPLEKVTERPTPQGHICPSGWCPVCQSTL